MTSLDKIRAYVFSPEKKKLSEKNQLKYENMRRCNQLLIAGYNTNQIVKMLDDQLQIGEAMAYKLLRETKDLFGDITLADKQGERYVIAEMYKKGIQKAMQLEDLHAYFHGLDSLSRILGITTQDLAVVNMQQLVMPQIIYANGDLETLKAEMEKTDFIEINE